jgi:glucosamine-6-phosphate deaminase
VAAKRAAQLIEEAVSRRGRARLIVATGNSQLFFIGALTEAPGVAWNAVEIFHMDEYAGISSDHPASFRRWVKAQVEEKVRPGAVYYLNGDAPDLQAETSRYSVLLGEAPIDLGFVGFGENAHIAFNEPGAARFDDPLAVRLITLDEASRRQQVGEGHFPDIESVPKRALTVTCPALLQASHWICCVPDLRKAEAVKCALEGPICPACPASAVRLHPSAWLYLDRESASLLSDKTVRKYA